MKISVSKTIRMFGIFSDVEQLAVVRRIKVIFNLRETPWC